MLQTKKGKKWNFRTIALLDAAQNSHHGLFNCGAFSLTLGFLRSCGERPPKRPDSSPRIGLPGLVLARVVRELRGCVLDRSFSMVGII